MSSTSSLYLSHTSFGEQTLLANFVPLSDVTGRTSAANVSYYDNTSGSPFYPSRAMDIGANLDLPASNAIVAEIAECLAEESDETYSYSPYRAGDKDWELFNNSTEAFPIIDSDFFEDADACVDSPAVPLAAAATITAEEEENIILDDFSYGNTEHLDFSNINEVLDNFEIRSQADYVPNEFEQSLYQETLLQHWQCDYQRHESVALKFQQPPYTTEAYSVPYTTEHQ
ncbi:hypothetical protein BKA61DRAFT_602233 [Leptodontidium sp. MPI-SDFR-AT-0119]|nr:hypothetical protein BKA61DRAFT_602233 [Leptodontidium sp. MPI-SDFR-AT-0119]